MRLSYLFLQFIKKDLILQSIFSASDSIYKMASDDTKGKRWLLEKIFFFPFLVHRKKVGKHQTSLR